MNTRRFGHIAAAAVAVAALGVACNGDDDFNNDQPTQTPAEDPLAPGQTDPGFDPEFDPDTGDGFGDQNDGLGN
jgi:hypothetical protein